MTKKRTRSSIAPHALSFSSSTSPAIDRRLFIQCIALACLGLPLLADSPRAYAAKASDETLAALDAVSAEYDAAMADLASIGYQLEEAQYNLSQCQANLDQTNEQIDELTTSILQKQDELVAAQDVLAARVNASYRAGSIDLLGVILDATSFDDFVSRLYYAGKVSDSDSEAIQNVKDIKAELEVQEQQLQEQKTLQEQLLAEQQQYTDELSNTVAYYEQYVAGLSAEVTALMNQAQAELIAAQQAEYEAYLAEQAAQAAQNQPAAGDDQTGDFENSVIPPESGDASSGNGSWTSPDDGYHEESGWDEPVYEDPSDNWNGGYTGGNHVYAVADIAWNYIGVPYVWGGTDPSGFDCSGLAQYCYAMAGYGISRTTYTQAAEISARGQMTYNMGDLQPGDLVFPHGGHVGIYEGGGMMIHAPYPGEYVKYASVYAFSFGGCPV